MGDFAQIALPIAAAAIAPYAAPALLGAGVSTGGAILAQQAGLAGLGAAGEFGIASAAATASPWAIAANVGLTGLTQLGALQQQRSQATIARARNDADRARLQRDFEVAERKRRSDLKRTLAQQRARFGAGGTSSASGSANAVLRGLQKQTDDASNDHLGSVRQQTASANRINLLEESSARKRGQFQAFQKTISPFIDLLEER